MTTAGTPIHTTSTGVHALLGDEDEEVARGRYVLADEPASTFRWDRYVGAHGVVIGMTSFGESAPLQSLQQRFGFMPDRIVGAAKELFTTNVV